MTCNKQRNCDLCEGTAHLGSVSNYISFPKAPERLVMSRDYGLLTYGNGRKWKPSRIIRLCDGCLDRALKLS